MKDVSIDLKIREMSVADLFEYAKSYSNEPASYIFTKCCKYYYQLTEKNLINDINNEKL